jgi:hypothetical protein
MLSQALPKTPLVGALTLPNFCFIAALVDSLVVTLKHSSSSLYQLTLLLGSGSRDTGYLVLLSPTRRDQKSL